MDLVSMTEIAQRAGVTVAAVKQWRVRYPDFPEPDAQLAIGPVWRWQRVVRWLRRTGRQGGEQ